MDSSVAEDYLQASKGLTVVLPCPQQRVVLRNPGREGSLHGHVVPCCPVSLCWDANPLLQLIRREQYLPCSK